MNRENGLSYAYNLVSSSFVAISLVLVAPGYLVPLFFGFLAFSTFVVWQLDNPFRRPLEIPCCWQILV